MAMPRGSVRSGSWISWLAKAPISNPAKAKQKPDQRLTVPKTSPRGTSVDGAKDVADPAVPATTAAPTINSATGTQVPTTPTFCSQRPASKPWMLMPTVNQRKPRTKIAEKTRLSPRPGVRSPNMAAALAAAKSSSDGK